MRIIYESVSLTQLLRVWTSRIVVLFIIVLACIHVSENPIAIVIIILLLLTLEIIIRVDKIIIYEDCLIWKKQYFFNFYIKKIKIHLTDIEIIETGTNTLKDEFFDVISKFELSSYLWIYLKNKKIITFRTSINRFEITEIVEIVNKLISK